MSNRDPLDQLASFRIQADERTRARDLEAIRTELQRTSSGRGVVRRRWTLGVVVALILAGPAAAIAADDALPGDLLYPIKLVAEPFVQLFDTDVVVEHRIEEVAGLVDRESDDVVIQERIDIARRALAGTNAPLLERELDRIVDRWAGDRLTPPDGRTDQPSTPNTRSRPAPTTSVPRDRASEPAPDGPPVSTTTTSDRPPATEPPPSDRTTPTAPGDIDDSPPPSDRPRDTP